MNFEMMLLADCVTLFSNNSSDSAQSAIEQQERKDLIAYIKALGEHFEVRAVAYHDLSSLNSSVANLYKAWLMKQGNLTTGNEESAVWKSKFIDFIEDHCKQRLIALQVKQNRHFDPVLFQEVSLLIESYYKLDNKVRII